MRLLILESFPLCRVMLTSVMKYLDRFLHAKASFWLWMPIRYKTRPDQPKPSPTCLSELLWMYMLQVVNILRSCEGGSSADGGQLLPGFWSSAGNHPCHQQGTLRPTCCRLNLKLFFLILLFFLIWHVSLRLIWKTLIQREWSHRLKRCLIFHVKSAFGWVGAFVRCFLVFSITCLRHFSKFGASSFSDFSKTWNKCWKGSPSGRG